MLDRQAAAQAEIRVGDVVSQGQIDAGKRPDFLPETKSVRDADWTVAPVPADLADRRVEITGPVDRKMVINALNSGASVFMAEFEDSHSPTWEGTLQGQINLRDAVRRVVEFDDPQSKVVYFMSLDDVKFRRPVLPGDQLLFELRMLQLRGRTCRMQGVTRVGETVVAEATMMARVMDK